MTVKLLKIVLTHVTKSIKSCATGYTGRKEIIMKYNYDELNNYRKLLVDTGDNLSWCRPFENQGVKWAVNEGKIVGMEVNGKDVDREDESVMRRVSEIIKNAYPNIDYTDDDPEDILQHKAKELGCCECPWFMVCDAMDAKYGEDDENDK